MKFHLSLLLVTLLCIKNYDCGKFVFQSFLNQLSELKLNNFL